MPESSSYRAGHIALAGPPNVGKSTLVNRLVGQHIAAVSAKPQTTRRHLIGLVHHEQCQIAVIDTPGVSPRSLNQLVKRMHQNARQGWEEADLLVVMLSAEETEPLKRLATLNLPAHLPQVVALNKVDTDNGQRRCFDIARALTESDPERPVVPISARKGLGIETLLEQIKQRLPQTEGPLYDSDIATPTPMRALAAELIREQLFVQLHQELPYCTEVDIIQFAERDNGACVIAADIVVEKTSQKAMVIGHQGQRLKSVGRESRLALEQLFDAPVFLQLWVKVREHWREDEKRINSLWKDN